MDTSKKKIEVKARVRVIGTIKGQELTRPENFDTIVLIDRWAVHQPAVAQTQVETATREAFVQEFRRRMRTDAATRRGVGGTRWSVDIIHFNYKDAV